MAADRIGKVDELEDFACSLTADAAQSLTSPRRAAVRATSMQRLRASGRAAASRTDPTSALPSGTELRTGQPVCCHLARLLMLCALYAARVICTLLQERVWPMAHWSIQFLYPALRDEQRLVLAVNLHYDSGTVAVIKHAQSRQEGLAEAIMVRRKRYLGITGVMMEVFNIIQDRIQISYAGDPLMSFMPTVVRSGLPISIAHPRQSTGYMKQLQ